MKVNLCSGGAVARWPDLGGEHGLPGLGDHVELLDGGGQVAGGPQVGEAHEATLGPHVVVGPVVPLVGGVGGWTRTHGHETAVNVCSNADREIHWGPCRLPTLTYLYPLYCPSQTPLSDSTPQTSLSQYYLHI